MERRKPREEQPIEPTRWIITYTDLCTLLLAFFVLLVSMSTIDGRRERKVLDSLVGAFGPMPGGRSISGRLKGSEAVEKHGTTSAGRTLDLQMLRDLNVRNQLQAEQVQAERNRTVLQIDQKILFRPGSTELNPEALGYLTEIADYLKENRKEIEIRGHTDFFEGIHQSEWSEQSWRISLRRAQSIYSYFQVRGIDVNRMSCHGYSYYRPAVNSQEYPHLSDKNQRVEIVIGPNDHIPAHWAQEGRTVARGVNYKNFFFRLFPEKETASEGTAGEKADIYEWLKEKGQ